MHIYINFLADFDVHYTMTFLSLCILLMGAPCLSLEDN